MNFHRLQDASDAYANGLHIPRSERWPEQWVKPAADYRAALRAAGRFEDALAYGSHPRQKLDLFHPQGTAKGLVVFIHGGYWKSLDRSYWSHFAHGAVARGFAVAMPSYRLCPEVRITQIGEDVAQAISVAAARVAGPIALTGHSAGGHLAARMISTGSQLPAEVLARVKIAVPLSGLFDLRPLMLTAMNDELQIDEAEALRESPALLRPLGQVRLAAWVGGTERQEFLRQNALLANIWTGLGSETAAYAEPDRHHFDVVDGLCDPDHPLCRLLTEI